MTIVTIKALSMATIKASLPDYFARTIGASFDAAYIKGAAVEEYAATLAGVAVEIAHSGNTNGLAFLRAKVDSLKLAKKHAAASVQGTLLARFESIKKQSLKSANITDYVEYADSMLCEALAILVPPKADTAPKAKAPNYKAMFEASQAENAALKIDNAALTESLAALRKVGTVTRAAFAPIGGVTSDNPEFTEVE